MLPSTLKRSPAKARRTWIKTHDSAVKEYGEGARAHRETFGGVDLYGTTKDELYERAKKLHIAGRSRMDKKELARAISRKQ